MALAVIGTGIAAGGSPAWAQMGQVAMAPTGGGVNRAVQGFQGLNENGPGILYYGINAADRGLGYQGSYMTLGGFVPGFEDDLGGFWAADLRGHLSTYGGFFSNVGAVRKQFLGGSLLGVGVYWDYDGDMNQYSDTTITDSSGSYVFAGGQVYNQVGISGEWLTDWGNLRSNGYIPVGTTAQYVGPFVENVVLCKNGVNAGLAGTDLEVGAYVPGLSDWAGMINVGGYAYGNSRYDFANGQDVVPWFGGVYTRLDMTFLENWDFSLQYNNDSYFDSTGFARLTYRMGGSRRRNVPDQMEQPMMRNEHIVRAHQTPEVAINPETGTPWRVIHVDNTSAVPGAGTAESPFPTVGQASTAATADYDIVYVHVGTSASGSPYITPASGFQFGAPNQYLIGEGSRLQIPTLDCGSLAIAATQPTSVYPVIMNPLGAALVVNQPDVTVNHLQITGSPVGISDGTGFLSPGVATISDVIISGNGPFQRGVEIANSTGTFAFDNVRLTDMKNDGLVVSAAGGVVNVTNSSFTSITGNAILASGDGAVVTASATQIAGTSGTAVHASGDAAQVTLSKASISNTAGDAILASGTGAIVNVSGSRITNTTGSALATAVSGTGATITATATKIDRTGNPAVKIFGAASMVTLNATSITNVTGQGAVVGGAGARFNMTNASRIRTTTGDGISVEGDNAFAAISGRSIIEDVDGDGINSTDGSIHVRDSTIQGVGGDGIDATSVDGNNVVWVQGSTITAAQENGIRVLNSNLRVERLDPTSPTSAATRITNTGVYGIVATADAYAAATSPYRVLVDSAQISGVINGIGVFANADPANPPTPSPPIVPPPPRVPTIDFTARNNNITATGGGISLSAIFDGSGGAPGQQLSQINALIVANNINVGETDTGILLNVSGDPTTFVDTTSGVTFTAPASQLPIVVAAANLIDLENLNNGTTVEITPINSRVNFNTGLVPATPPPPPAQPPP